MNTQGAGDEGSFESRLAAARNKRGLDPTPPAQDADGKMTTSMGVGLKVGVELLSALIVGLAIGWFLDRWLHTSPAMLIVRNQSSLSSSSPSHAYTMSW